MGLIRTFAQRGDLNNDSDVDLLLQASLGDDPLIARDAQIAFYQRHVEFVYGICHQYRQILGGDEGVRTLVLRTFQQAFEKADTFSDDGITNPERLRKRTRLWLSQIAKNLFRDALRIRQSKSKKRSHEPLWVYVRSETEESLLPQHDHAVQAEDVNDPSSVEMQALLEGLEQLTEKEREVLLISFEYFVPGQQLRLPDDVRKGLITRLRTTDDGLRAMRYRAFKKLKAFVKVNV